MEKKILIVEDDEMNLRLTVDLLQMAGYQTIPAHNGADGVKLALRHQPHLIIMDMQMPIMDGVEAVRRLKGDEATNTIPIMALTAYAMPDDEKKFRAVGCDGYMSKPFDVKIFFDEIASLVE